MISRHSTLHSFAPRPFAFAAPRPFVLAALLALAVAPSCNRAVVAASDDLRYAPRPYAFVLGEGQHPTANGGASSAEWVPVAPLRRDHNLLILPLLSRSERVPRPATTDVGVEVALVAGTELVKLDGAVRGRWVKHTPDERVLITEAGPRLFGPARLPVRTEPPRALASLARQDGVLTDTRELRCELPSDLGTANSADGAPMFVVGHGEWGTGVGAESKALDLDGVPHRLGLGPNDVVAVPAAAHHRIAGNALDADIGLDHAAVRFERSVDLEALDTLAPTTVRPASLETVRLERRFGLGVDHPVPTFRAMGADDESPNAAKQRDAAAQRGEFPRGAALVVCFAAPTLAEGETATLLLDFDVRQGFFAAEVTEPLRVADSDWLKDVTHQGLVAGERGLLAHFEGPDGQLDIRPTMGPGAAIGDFDGDGWPDLYLVQGGGREGSEPDQNRLLRNLGASRKAGGPWFEDVTQHAGVGDTGRGMGALFVDLDGDGRLDLYVANYGQDRLYLNRGNGTFADATSSLPELDLWSAAVAAADTDGDGDLDLYVTSYLDYDTAAMPPALELDRYQREDPLEMLPFAFPGQRNVFLRNESHVDTSLSVTPQNNGALTPRPLRFSDVTEELGLANVEGRSMQAVFWDFDRDGDQDLYVANDVSYNVLYRNEGDGTFQDVSFATGLDDPRGGMGLAASDLDGDGDEDLVLTNWQLDTNALYVNSLVSRHEARTRRASFQDSTVRAGLAQAGVGLTSWGVGAFDLELDGDLDLFVANGYTSPDYSGTGICVGQPNHLYVNEGGARFRFAQDIAPRALGVSLASRAVCLADFDRDGDIDVVITANNGPVQILENVAPRAGEWLGLELRQPGPNPFAIGAEVTVHTRGPQGAREHRRALRAGEGYLGGNPPELHFGLGQVESTVSVTVRWPDGDESVHGDVQVNRWSRIERDATAAPAAPSSESSSPARRER